MRVWNGEISLTIIYLCWEILHWIFGWIVKQVGADGGMKEGIRLVLRNVIDLMRRLEMFLIIVHHGKAALAKATFKGCNLKKKRELDGVLI